MLAELGARHKRTRPYRPQMNGKSERFIKDDARRVGVRPTVPLQ
jgi:transposase InsO family protein